MGPNQFNTPDGVSIPHPRPPAAVITQPDSTGLDLLLSAAHHSESPSAFQEYGIDDALASQTPIASSPQASPIHVITQAVCGMRLVVLVERFNLNSKLIRNYFN